MELALYCPVYGYYEKEGDTVGRGGDFYTSVSVGSLFGELLAFQFAEWLEESQSCAPNREPVLITEAGAHRGELAKDILHWLREWRPALFESTKYWILEPSPQRQQWQRSTLSEFASYVRWAKNHDAWAEARTKEPPSITSGIAGVIFSNELLDAFPVHRLGWDAGDRTWFEWGVGLSRDQFVWVRLPAEHSVLREPHSAVSSALRPFEGITQSGVLPDGFTVEVCPAATAWWARSANLLARGKLLTIDYGFREDELLAPGRNQGTLRTYYRHQQSDNPLEHPGQQDITAHVNFTAIQAAGEGVGLQTDGFSTQAQFLTSVAARTWERKSSFGKWTPARRKQLLTLTHPDHLGRAFRVLIQSRTP